MDDNGKSRSRRGKADLSKHVSGIHCMVQNCVYHAKDSECCAGAIEVGPNYADSSADTICSTFKSE